MDILKESGCSPPVLRHCKTVAELAVRIAEKCARNGTDVDVQLVRVGALLHDIGRSKTHSVHHPVVGARIARALGLPESIVSIIKRHLGGGISVEEASEFGWPSGTYMPETLEEKIVTYADKLVEGAEVVPVERAVRKLMKRLGASHPSAKRIMNLHEEISTLCHDPDK
ncbi:MAG: TIGR00295 family protein [Candidatus Bathyarchaeota archaeon]|nr:TIGR00295 family protein [Candidatus Bathyarchaeota archaeon]